MPPAGGERSTVRKNQYNLHIRLDEDERAATLEALDIRVCMECGCCAYVCPAHRPLVQTNREAMQFVRKYKAAHAEKKEGGK